MSEELVLDPCELSDTLTEKKLLILGMSVELGRKITISDCEYLYTCKDDNGVDYMVVFPWVSNLLVIAYILCNSYQGIYGVTNNFCIAWDKKKQERFMANIKKYKMENTILGRIFHKICGINQLDQRFELTPEIFQMWNEYADGDLATPNIKSARKI